MQQQRTMRISEVRDITDFLGSDSFDFELFGLMDDLREMGMAAMAGNSREEFDRLLTRLRVRIEGIVWTEDGTDEA